MWIVSQDKETIINSENIKEITVDDGDVCITDNIYKDIGEVIGSYYAEERAKEVLQEIIKREAEFELFRKVPAGRIGHTNMLNKFTERKIILGTYEMPEE